MLENITESQIRELTELAKIDIKKIADKYSSIMKVEYKKISIKHQKTRWGSCSSKKNLNFNCLLMLAPIYVREYVVIHELAHLKEMNHSKKFWALVEHYMVDYKKAESWLKKEGIQLIRVMIKGIKK